MENKFIQELSLCYVSDKSNVYKLFFNKGVNIIIGPKGGGKSTLLNVLHSLRNEMQPNKKCLDAIKEYGFEIKGIKYSSGEELEFGNLVKYIKEKTDDLIKQDDDVKTKLNENKEIEEDKRKFITSLIEEHTVFIANLFENYFRTFQNICDLKNDSINWGLLLSGFSTKNKVSLEYQKELSNRKMFENIDKNVKDYKALEVINEVYQSLMNEIDPNLYLKCRNVLDEIKSKHIFKTNKILLNKSMNDSFKKTLLYLESKIKDSTDKNEQNSLLKTKAQKLFEELAINFSNNCAYFKHFSDGRIKFHLEGSKESKFDMILSIDKTIELKHTSEEEDSWTKEIMEKFLYATTQKKTHWINWLKRANKEDNPFKNKVDIDDTKTIINKLLYDKIQESVKLNADGKDYNTMSLGTKTSFGLKQKIKNFNSSIIFLDQPEDNLDNYTIYKEILSLFENSKINQVFLVTHNSNLGSLTKPSTITTCNLIKNDLQKSYVQNTSLIEKIQINEEIKDSPVLHYLEGGEESLIKREQELIKKGRE